MFAPDQVRSHVSALRQVRSAREVFVASAREDRTAKQYLAALREKYEGEARREALRNEE